MTFQGRLDAVAAQAITGWVCDLEQPGRVIEVALEAQGEVVATVRADLPRDDLRALKLPNSCGFAFSLRDVAVADPARLRVRVAGEGWLVGENPIILGSLRSELPRSTTPAPFSQPEAPAVVYSPVQPHVAAQEQLLFEVEALDELLAELRRVLARCIIATADSPAMGDRLRAVLGERKTARGKRSQAELGPSLTSRAN